MRTGINLRFADPALTMQQMVFAIVAMAAAYVINPPVRGMLLMIVALVLYLSVQIGLVAFALGVVLEPALRA